MHILKRYLWYKRVFRISGNWHCPLLAWRSTAEQLRDPSIQGIPKRICNMVKKFLNNTNCCIWYHNANSDHTAQFERRHLHVLCRTTETVCGSDKQLHNDCKYRGLKQLIESHGGYCKSQGIRNLYAIIRHFCEPPRIYMGSRSHDLGLIVLQLHLDQYGVGTTVRPFRTVRNELVHPKDTLTYEESSQCIYRILCKNCDKVYVNKYAYVQS